MSPRIINLARRDTAAAERDRLDALLQKIEALRPLRVNWDEIESDELSDEAWNMLEQCHEVEGELLKLALDPDLADFLVCIRDELASIAEGRPCV